MIRRVAARDPSQCVSASANARRSHFAPALKNSHPPSRDRQGLARDLDGANADGAVGRGQLSVEGRGLVEGIDETLDRLRAHSKGNSAAATRLYYDVNSAVYRCDQRGNGDYFSRTIVKEPGRAAGRTTHPEFRVTLQPSPCRVVPSSGPVTGTDSVAPSAARKTPPLALRRPH